MPIVHQSTPNGPLRKVWELPHTVSITAQDLDPGLLNMVLANRGVGIVSNPPAGCFQIVNIYVDPNGKLVVKWSDTPQGV